MFSETHKLNGFDEFATIPVNYPLDICLMEIDKNLYAVCLNIERTDLGNLTMLKVLKKVVSIRSNSGDRQLSTIIILFYLSPPIHKIHCTITISFTNIKQMQPGRWTVYQWEQRVILPL